MPCPYSQNYRLRDRWDATITQLIVGKRHCRILISLINCRETALPYPNFLTQNNYLAQLVPRHIVKNKTLEIKAPNSHLIAFLNNPKR